MPVSVLVAIVCGLRTFEKNMKGRFRFTLPDSLRAADALDLRIVIGDGQFLYVLLRSVGAEPEVFGGIDLRSLRSGAGALDDLAEGALEQIQGRSSSLDWPAVGGPEGSTYWRVEVSVTRVAQDLPLDG